MDVTLAPSAWSSGGLDSTIKTAADGFDGVLFVQWALLLPDGTDAPSLSNVHYDAKQPTVASEPSQHYDNLKVCNAVNRLRDAGYLMLQPEDEASIWVFELPKPAKAVKDERKADYTQALRHCGFAKSRAGSLRALDLKDALAADFEDFGNEHPSSEARSKAAERIETRKIYQRFIAAVTRSMLYSLAASTHYLPVTSNTFLDIYALPWNPSKYSSLGLNSADNGTWLSTLDVQWFPSGSLVISSSFSSRLVWPQTQRSVFDSLSSQPTSASIPVILAPFGILAESAPALRDQGASTIGTVLGDHDTERGATNFAKSRRKWFESLVVILQYYGVSVPSDTHWLPVRVSLRHKLGTNEDSTSSSSEVIFWPASLCLASDLDVLKDEDDKSWAWDDGDSKANDPLANAQAWYLGKDAREKMLEAQRREEQLKAQADKNPPSDEGERLRNEVPNAQKFLDAQTASSIYPTPPDGQPFHTSTSAIAGDSESTRLVEDIDKTNAHSTAEEDPMNIDSAPIGLHRLDSQHVDHDDMDEDDIFGGMNSGMFTATGLTEDDFNFFDERDEPLKMTSSPHSVPSLSVESPTSVPGVREHSMEDGNRCLHAEGSPEESFEPQESPETFALRNEAIQPSSNVAINSHYPSETHGGKYQSPTDTQIEDTTIQRREHNSSDDPGISLGSNQIDDAYNTTPGLSALDRKYSTFGKYASDLGSRPLGQLHPSISQNLDATLPHLDLLHREEDSDESSVSEDDLSRSRTPSIIFEWPSGPVDRDTSTTTRSTLKRKRSQSQLDDMEGIEGEYVNQTPQERDEPPATSISVQQLISSNYPNLVQELATSSSPAASFAGQGREFVNLAQVVTAQAILKSSFDFEDSWSFDYNILSRSVFDHPPSEDPLREVVTRFFPHSKRTELSSRLVATEQSTSATHPLKVLPKPPLKIGDSSKGPRRLNLESESIFELPGPNVLAHRAENLMELSSIALNFWEELGLGPCKGAKDVRAICVVPKSDPVRRAVSTFHDAISGTWQSMRFGSHTPLGNIDELRGGCLEVPFVRSDMEENFDRLTRACEDLGQLIHASEVNRTNLVIYMMNPGHPIKALPHLCEAFMRLKDVCDNFIDARGLNLVLKVVPLSMFAARYTIALLSPTVYRQLARDVYDLSALLNPLPDPVSMTCSSLAQLAGEIPKRLDFRLTADASSPLAISDSTYHVAYSCDEQRDWLAMAFTDAHGSQYWKASYCLKALTSDSGLQDIFRDIWEIALDMIGSAKAYSRLVVTKDESFSPFEINAWTSLASDPTTASVTLILVSLDLSPPLQLSCSPPQPSAQSRQQAIPSTPLTPSTPGPNTPTSVGPLDTSSIDPSLRLISTEDQMWAVLNVQPIDHDPAVPVSGHSLLVMYAIAPDGVRDSGGESFRSIVVKIVHHTLPCIHTLSRDILKAFKALGTLAKARGVMGARGGLIPWHIAVAREARMALNENMRWET